MCAHTPSARSRASFRGGRSAFGQMLAEPGIARFAGSLISLARSNMPPDKAEAFNNVISMANIAWQHPVAIGNLSEMFSVNSCLPRGGPIRLDSPSTAGTCSGRPRGTPAYALYFLKHDLCCLVLLCLRCFAFTIFLQQGKT